MNQHLSIVLDLEEKEFFCSFCGNDKSRVRQLIAGPSEIFICGECIKLSTVMLDTVNGGTWSRPLGALRQWLRMTQYSFDNFIVGDSNRVAYDAAKEVVSSPGQIINNPLVIYGGNGLGKTHLLQAIANQFASEQRQAKVSYLHCEKYVGDIVRAYQTNTFCEFKDWYHNLDLLLIDDIQFILGKSRSQEELITIIETLLESDKQVVFAGDQLLQDVIGLNYKLASLLRAGNVIAIAPPELELRTAIVTQALHDFLGAENQTGVAAFIAQLAPTDIRQLLGATKRVCAQAPFTQSLNLELAKQILDDLVKSQDEPDATNS